MKRDADNNRVVRSIMNIESAITHIESIKFENRTVREEDVLNSVVEDLSYARKRLHRLIGKGGES